MGTLSFVWIFLGFMVIGLPIALALAAGPMAYFVLMGKAMFLKTLPQKLIGGINQFPLLAIPLFILAGEIMNVGGITQRLVSLSNALVGHFRGGLAQVNIFSSILFAGLSGSAVADTSALGSMLIPAMEKDGYTRKFAAAVTAASSIIGPIIPPSIMMVIYAFVMQVSVAGLFLAGFVPGVLIGIGLMFMTRLLAKKKDYPVRRQRATLKELGIAFKGGILPLLTPVIILFGIIGGVFTPTEAAAVAVVYALILSVFVLRTIPIRQIPNVFFRGMVSSASILLIVSTAALFGWVATLSGAPRHLAGFMLTLTDNPLLILLFTNIFLLFVGMFLDAGPAILIVGPIIAPMVLQAGVNPLHFAIIMCVNLSVGLATPPMGLVLFVSSTVSGASVGTIYREMLPFYAVHILMIGLITYVPILPMTLPRIFGFA